MTKEIDLQEVSYRHEQGDSISLISSQLGICSNRLSREMKKAGYRIYSANELRDSVIQKAIELHSKGLNLSQMSKELGVSLEALSKHLKSKGYKVGQNIPNNEDLAKAAFEYKEGKSILSIASAMDYDPGTLSTYLKKVGCPVARGMGYKMMDTSDYGLNQSFTNISFPEYNYSHQLLDLTNMETHYWLGLLAADGCISDKGKVNLALVDKGLVESFKKFIGIDNKIGRTVRKKASHNDIYSYGFTDIKLLPYLINIGLTPRKTKTLEWNIPMCFPFIRGLIDGDGCVSLRSSNSVSVRITTASECFSTQVSAFLINSGINCKVYRNRNLYEVAISNRQNVYNLYKHIYFKAESFLERKRCKYQCILDVIEVTPQEVILE